MRHTTIIVDDDADDRISLQHALQQNNISSIGVFEKPEKAFEYLKKAEILPRLVITDYNMPALNGEELLVKIKTDERLQDVAVVIMSSIKSKTHVERWLQLGALAWYTKPWSKEDADIVVKDLLSIINPCSY